MQSLKSSERHIALLKGSIGFRSISKPTNRFKPNFCKRQLSGNHLTSRFNILRSARPIKLLDNVPTRVLSNKSDVSFFNPKKSYPDEIEMPRPIHPRTSPRFVKITGVETLPAVTKILQDTMPASSKYMLDKWKEAMVKKLGAAGFAKYQQETFERGKVLHALLASFLLGQGEPGLELTKEIHANLWKSIQGVVKENISNVRLVEHTVTHSDMGYRGIVDCVAFYRNELVVIDFKTAEKPKMKIEDLYDNPLQVSAYCGALNNDHTIPLDVIDRNICAGLVIVAYTDGSEASVHHLQRERLNYYWTKWTERLQQFVRSEDYKQTVFDKN